MNDIYHCKADVYAIRELMSQSRLLSQQMTAAGTDPNPLIAQCHSVLAAGALLKDDLEQLSHCWQQLKNPNLAPPLAQLYFRQLVAELAAIQHESQQLRQFSAQLHTLTQEALPPMQNRSQQLGAQIRKLESENQEHQQALEKAQAEYNRAKAELSGDKGFLNGFLTGVSFGIYNPIKKNLETQKKAIHTINMAISQIRTAQVELEQNRTQLDTVTKLALKVTDVSTHLIDLENAANAAYAKAQEAAREEARIQGASPRAAEYYTQHFDQDIDALLAWQSCF